MNIVPDTEPINIWQELYLTNKDLPILEGDEREEVLKIIEKQNGRALALALAGRNITREILPLLEYVGHVEPSVNLLTYLSEAMFSSQQENFEEEYLKEFLTQEYSEDDDLLQACENKDYQTVALKLLEKAGYVAYIADTIEKQNALKTYFAEGEELCTFKDPLRFKTYHTIHYIKKELIDDLPGFYKALEANDEKALSEIFAKNKDVIKRSAVPQRQDEYGTSVGSIQILKTGGFISIKNRYNHSVAGCDQTFDSNPDKIIKGLSTALRLCFGVEFSDTKLPEGLINSQKGYIMQYYLERMNVYYGEKAYMVDGIITPLSEDQIAVEDMVIDLKEKKIFSPKTIGKVRFFDKVLTEKAKKRRALAVTKDKKNNALILRMQEEGRNWQHFMTIKNGRLVKVSLPRIRTTYLRIDNYPELTEVYAPDIEKVNDFFCSTCPNLQFVKCDNLKEIGMNAFPTKGHICAPKIAHFDMNAFLEENDCAPINLNLNLLHVFSQECKGKSVSVKKKQKGTCEICVDGVPVITAENGNITKIHLPSTTHLPKCGICYLKHLKEFSAPNLVKIEKDNFVSVSLDIFDCPKLQEVGSEVFFFGTYMTPSKVYPVDFLKMISDQGLPFGKYPLNFLQVLGQELVGKKISLHPKKRGYSLKANGRTIMQVNGAGRIKALCLPSIKVLPEKTINFYDLEVIIAPKLEEIKGENFDTDRLKYGRFDRLKKVEEKVLRSLNGYVYAPRIYPVDVYRLLRRKGVSIERMPFKLACTLSREMKGKKLSVLKTDKSVKTFLNGQDFMTIENRKIVELNLPTTRRIQEGGLNGGRYHDFRVISAPKLKVFEGYLDTIWCDYLEVNFPNLVSYKPRAFNGIKKVHLKEQRNSSYKNLRFLGILGQVYNHAKKTHAWTLRHLQGYRHKGR